MLIKPHTYLHTYTYYTYKYSSTQLHHCCNQDTIPPSKDNTQN